MRTKEEIAAKLLENQTYFEPHITALADSVASEISRLEQQIEELKKDKVDKPTTKDIEVAKVLGLI